MPNYRRARAPGGMFFFTVVLAERSKTTLIDYIDVLRDVIRAAQAARPFRTEAMVVLPDHLHTVWTLPADDADYATRWAMIKAAFSRRLPRGERRSASRVSKRERGVWQRRYWEHLIRNDDDRSRHVDYIHFNPVKHGYVKRAIDWPYSSIHRFLRNGWCTADWVADLGVSAENDRAPFD